MVIINGMRRQCCLEEKDTCVYLAGIGADPAWDGAVGRNIFSPVDFANMNAAKAACVIYATVTCYAVIVQKNAAHG